MAGSLIPADIADIVASKLAATISHLVNTHSHCQK